MLFEWRYCSPWKYKMRQTEPAELFFVHLADLSEVETAVRLQQLLFLIYDPLKEFPALQILQHQDGFPPAVKGFNKSEYLGVKYLYLSLISDIL